MVVDAVVEVDLVAENLGAVVAYTAAAEKEVYSAVGRRVVVALVVQADTAATVVMMQAE